MDSPILLSIVIPVYNGEATLSRCLDSILCQVGEDIEVLLVNDGSKDNSQRIIDQYVTTCPKILRTFSKANEGPGATRNFGIQNATGKYVTFVDSDDYVSPDYVETVISIIKRHDPDMVVIGYERAYEKKRSLMERIHRFSTGLPTDQTVTLAERPEIIAQTEGAPWLRIIRRELIIQDDRLLFSKARIAEDQEASLKWFLQTEKIHFCSKKLYRYVIRDDSLNFSTKNLSDFIDVLRSVCSYYESRAAFMTYAAELESVFIKQLLVSNLRRLKASDLRDKYGPFMTLRSTLMEYFPSFHKNKYLAREPVYIRLATWLSWRYPVLFKYIL